ncbi:extracellular metallo proteinase mep [Aspergillus keveii]|uniref:Extracellular metalloproteinase n=1 Tax=Aspergillus keveii TaxID=714993 RepID=A0ABR4FWQ0_9EURO
MDSLLSTRQSGEVKDYLAAAKQLVETLMPNATFRVVDDHYVGDNRVAHVFLRQTIDGFDVDNADFNVNVGKDGKVFSYGNSFYTGAMPEAAKSLSKRDPGAPDALAALKGASSTLGLGINTEAVAIETAAEERHSYVLKSSVGAVSDPKAKLVYFVTSDGILASTWRVETNIGSNWLLTYLDAENTSNVHGVVDYVSAASFEVYDFDLSNPSEGPRTLVTDPWDLYTDTDPAVSPFTWLGDGNTTYSTTRGNNGIAQANPISAIWVPYLRKFRPYSSNLEFQYLYSPSMSPPESYWNASVVQLFYTANAYHDLLHVLGFNEQAGNYQWDNNGKGGRGGDYIILNTQDYQTRNNAYFSAPPDGQPGELGIMLYINTTPYRDGSFDATLVLHEYTHGLSHRLTGGPLNAGCLTGLESSGMDEGWSEFMATAVRLKATDTRATDYGMFDWASNKTAGTRIYPYSTSLTTNPVTYATVNTFTAGFSHKIGTVWASMLYENKNRSAAWTKPAFGSDGVPINGKHLAMKLFQQPCNPTFIQARDAILDADTVLTNGANHCEIWAGFAKRGLGRDAQYSETNRTDSTALPFGVC